MDAGLAKGGDVVPYFQPGHPLGGHARTCSTPVRF